MTIGEVCATISDTYRAKADEVTLINTSDVLEGKVLNHARVPNKELKGQFKKTFKKNDILYSEIRPQNKRFAFVDFDPVDYIASTKLMVLRADTTKVLPMYLYFYLKSEPVISELQMLAETRSGTFPQITFTELSNLTIPVPSIAKQKEISDTIQCIEDKMSCNAKINDNLQQQAATLFKALFVDFVPFDGTMPPNWTISTLGDATEMGAGGDKPKESSPVKTTLCPYPIYSNGINDYGLYGYTNEPKIKVESVTVSARGTIGYVCLRHIPYVPIVRLVTLIPDTKILSAKYLYLYLRQLHITGTGTTQQQLTVPDFRKTEIIIPDKNTMDSFTETVTPLFEQIWENEDENAKLAEVRDALLPKLMSGEIDVSDIQL